MGQVYQCWWRLCREIHVFSRFEYHIFYVMHPFVTYLLTFPRSEAQEQLCHYQIIFQDRTSSVGSVGYSSDRHVHITDCMIRGIFGK
jgi:hypothetical protein